MPSPLGETNPTMHKLICFICLLSVSLKVFSQDPLKRYVKSNAIVINTIEPDSTDYSDLAAIGNAIGAARVVMLGEQDHGDAPTFLAKTRLIKYLHEKKGFNVLAFESDFFGLNYGWDNLHKEKDEIAKFIRGNIYPIWTYCHTCLDLLYDYIPSTYQSTTPLTLTGFDNQLALHISTKDLVVKLDSVLKSLNLPIINQNDYNTIIKPSIDTLIRFQTVLQRSDNFYARCGGYLETIRQQVGEKQSKDDFWTVITDNLIQVNAQFQANKQGRRTAENIRDFQMAQNLKWLSQVKYPNEKIIVWAANAHVAKYADSSGKKNQNKIVRMGHFFTMDSLLMRQTYIIGFTSYKGTAGRLGGQTFKIREPKKDGFENWINHSYNYAFVDFKAYNNLHPGQSQMFYLKGLGHQSFFKYDWTQVFDGVFYIRDMYPCIGK